MGITMELSLTSLASMGNHALRGGDYVTKKVPPELHDRLRRYHKGFDYDVKGVKYEGAKHGKNIALMEDLGLTDYFLDRFGVVGTPGDIVDRLHYLETLGVEQIGIAVHRLHDLRLLGEKVLPAFM